MTAKLIKIIKFAVLIYIAVIMARTLAIDYGVKRIGIAVSDPLGIIANGLTTIKTPEIFSFLKEYFSKNDCHSIVIGYPKTLQNKPVDIIPLIDEFIGKLNLLYPGKQIIKYDERFTSKLAFKTIIKSGIGKQKRQNKALIDKISATIILQSYLESKR